MTHEGLYRLIEHSVLATFLLATITLTIAVAWIGALIHPIGGPIALIICAGLDMWANLRIRRLL